MWSLLTRKINSSYCKSRFSSLEQALHETDTLEGDLLLVVVPIPFVIGKLVLVIVDWRPSGTLIGIRAVSSLSESSDPSHAEAPGVD